MCTPTLAAALANSAAALPPGEQSRLGTALRRELRNFTKENIMVQPIPAGYHNTTPYLMVRNAAAAIDFYKKAFNAVELMRFPGPGGKIMHAEVKIGDSPVMLAEEMPEEGHVGPQTLGGAAV